MKKPTVQFGARHSACWYGALRAAWPVHKLPPPTVQRRRRQRRRRREHPGPAPTPDQISYLFGLIFGAQMHHTGITDQAVVSDAVVRGTEGRPAGQTATRRPINSNCRLTRARRWRSRMAARNAGRREGIPGEQRARRRAWSPPPPACNTKFSRPGDRKAPPITPTDDVTVRLSRQAAQRHGIRQLLLARHAGDLPGERRHQGLAGSVGADEAGCQMAAVRAARAGLWRHARSGDPRRIRC